MGTGVPYQTIVVIGQTIPIQLQWAERKVIFDERRNHLNHCLFSVVPDVLRVENLFDDDDGDDIVENPTSLISNTDGMKASEAALCDMEQQPSASPIDEMLIKKWRNYASSCRTSRLQQKKITHFFNDCDKTSHSPEPGIEFAFTHLEGKRDNHYTGRGCTRLDMWFIKSFPTALFAGNGFRNGFSGNAFADLSFKPWDCP
ncbi:hypothetical protein AVEN_124802-1 [Araneus ventricosus]|uniref:Uncharacterized protein n=1 Tax=Araneus ventricosus TaxID=182803 RepID=A0A4Y2W2U3_ARAVE|nr:hypothetical protein AVEN_97860-1 [Araneus ventricosus]GBO30460.1 hypothetical protein AVEN_124802-1 [Araneus ventricosus]